MKKLMACAALAAFVMAAPACKRQRKVQVQTEEEAGQMMSLVQMADPKATAQLLKGFHAVEGNAWRWTAGTFAVALRPPAGAAQKGARLMFKFVIPDVVLSKFKALNLSASVGGQALPPESYTTGGEFTFTRDVDARVLGGEAVNVEFKLDKSIPPGEVDQRELGVIATQVGLELK